MDVHGFLSLSLTHILNIITAYNNKQESLIKIQWEQTALIVQSLTGKKITMPWHNQEKNSSKKPFVNSPESMKEDLKLLKKK